MWALQTNGIQGPLSDETATQFLLTYMKISHGHQSWCLLVCVLRILTYQGCARREDQCGTHGRNGGVAEEHRKAMKEPCTAGQEVAKLTPDQNHRRTLKSLDSHV